MRCLVVTRVGALGVGLCLLAGSSSARLVAPGGSTPALPSAGGGQASSKPGSDSSAVTAVSAASATSPDAAHVRFDAWLSRLLQVLDTTPAPTVEREFLEFATRRGLDVNDVNLRRDFRRVRLLFEATRDGGFWHLRWAITNEKPSSRNIWKQFGEQPVETNFGIVAATAECDELSALMGMLAKHAGISNVGLFYPTWNHTIAVWAPLGGKTHTPLVQLPTSQIFLGCDAGFDHTTFQTTRTNIQAFPAFDLRPHSLLPVARANWLIEQIERYAEGSFELWSLVRAHRAFVMDSSMGDCNAKRAEWAQAVSQSLTAADERILVSVGRQELEMLTPTAQRVLTWLSLQYPPASQHD